MFGSGSSLSASAAHRGVLKSQSLHLWPLSTASLDTEIFVFFKSKTSNLSSRNREVYTTSAYLPVLASYAEVVPGVMCMYRAGSRNLCSTRANSVDSVWAPSGRTKTLLDCLPDFSRGLVDWPTPDVVPESATIDGTVPFSIPSFTDLLRPRRFLVATKYFASAFSIPSACGFGVLRFLVAMAPLNIALITLFLVCRLAYFCESFVPFELCSGFGVCVATVGGDIGRW